MTLEFVWRNQSLKPPSFITLSNLLTHICTPSAFLHILLYYKRIKLNYLIINNLHINIVDD